MQEGTGFGGRDFEVQFLDCDVFRGLCEEEADGCEGVGYGDAAFEAAFCEVEQGSDACVGGGVEFFEG